MIRFRSISKLRLAVFLNVSTFSFSVLKSSSGCSKPCIVFVLSISKVRFSEKSICPRACNETTAPSNKKAHRFAPIPLCEHEK